MGLFTSQKKIDLKKEEIVNANSDNREKVHFTHEFTNRN